MPFASLFAWLTHNTDPVIDVISIGVPATVGLGFALLFVRRWARFGTGLTVGSVCAIAAIWGWFLWMLAGSPSPW